MGFRSNKVRASVCHGPRITCSPFHRNADSMDGTCNGCGYGPKLPGGRRLCSDLVCHTVRGCWELTLRRVQWLMWTRTLGNLCTTYSNSYWLWADQVCCCLYSSHIHHPCGHGANPLVPLQMTHSPTTLPLIPFKAPSTYPAQNLETCKKSK
jgi:hypothetical protein